MYKLRNLVKDVRSRYNSFLDSIFPVYRLSPAGAGLNDNPPLHDGICFMTRPKGSHKKLGLSGKPKRVHRGVNLPGYEPGDISLKDFLKQNYILSENELCRVLKRLGGGKKQEAMKLLSKRRKQEF